MAGVSFSKANFYFSWFKQSPACSQPLLCGHAFPTSNSGPFLLSWPHDLWWPSYPSLLLRAAYRDLLLLKMTWNWVLQGKLPHSTMLIMFSLLPIKHDRDSLLPRTTPSPPLRTSVSAPLSDPGPLSSPCPPVPLFPLTSPCWATGVVLPLSLQWLWPLCLACELIVSEVLLIQTLSARILSFCPSVCGGQWATPQKLPLFPHTGPDSRVLKNVSFGTRTLGTTKLPLFPVQPWEGSGG